MSEGYGAVVAGHICLDVIPACQGSKKTGSSLCFYPAACSKSTRTFSTGGPVSNTGLACTSWYRHSAYGQVGDDLFGERSGEL